MMQVVLKFFIVLAATCFNFQVAMGATRSPTRSPTVKPSIPPPTSVPSSVPTSYPTSVPTSVPSPKLTLKPSRSPTMAPSRSRRPTAKPSISPTFAPSRSMKPTTKPSISPTFVPSRSMKPTAKPSPSPTFLATRFPTRTPSRLPTKSTNSPTTKDPTIIPTSVPTSVPSSVPTSYPTSVPTSVPTSIPSSRPSIQPSSLPSAQPSAHPSFQPTSQPSTELVGVITRLSTEVKLAIAGAVLIIFFGLSCYCYRKRCRKTPPDDDGKDLVPEGDASLNPVRKDGGGGGGKDNRDNNRDNNKGGKGSGFGKQRVNNDEEPYQYDDSNQDVELETLDQQGSYVKGYMVLPDDLDKQNSHSSKGAVKENHRMQQQYPNNESYDFDEEESVSSGQKSSPNLSPESASRPNPNRRDDYKEQDAPLANSRGSSKNSSPVSNQQQQQNNNGHSRLDEEFDSNPSLSMNNSNNRYVGASAPKNSMAREESVKLPSYAPPPRPPAAAASAESGPLSWMIDENLGGVGAKPKPNANSKPSKPPRSYNPFDE